LPSLTYSSAVTNTDYLSLEKLSEMAVKEKQKFERLVISKEKLLEMFAVRLSLWTLDRR
jgi:threonyl-tRNA synthetase